MIFVSVVVPGFQAEAYAKECLEGLLSQASGQVEVLCVNDGSSDGTGALLDEMAEADERVRVWHTENRGVSAARNLALTHARGEYVAFVDMDDRLPEGALAALFGAAGAADIVVGDYERVYAGGERALVTLPEQITREMAMHSIVSGEGTYNAPWGKLYRHDFLWEHALMFSEVVRIGEDALFNLQAFDLADGISHAAAPVYAYMERDGSAMAQAAADRYVQHVPMLDAMDAYLRRTGQKEAYYRDFLQQHAALIRAQYPNDAAKRFAKLARERVQRGITPRSLPPKQRALYNMLELGMGGAVYRRLMQGVA